MCHRIEINNSMYNMPMGKLYLVRHGESEGNKQGLLNGQNEVSLTNTGFEQALIAASQLYSSSITHVFTSKQLRARQTADCIINTFQNEFTRTENEALNERDFGDYTGLPKTTVKQLIGEDGYRSVVKGWDTPAPNGEALSDTYKRTIGYFNSMIAPLVASDAAVLIVSHHQTLRCLVKFLEHIDDNEIADVHIQNAQVLQFVSHDGISFIKTR